MNGTSQGPAKSEEAAMEGDGKCAAGVWQVGAFVGGCMGSRWLVV